MLDLDREDRLVQLAQDRPIFREVEVLDELLRDRAAALVETQMQQVIQAGLARAQQAPSGGGSATARAVSAVGLDRVAAVRAERTNVVDGLHYTKRLTNDSRWAPRTPLR